MSISIYCITAEIHDEFLWFGALHRILSSRPNIVPPAIVTSVGPAGREIIYNNPPPPSQERDPNIDPTLDTLGPDYSIHTPPPSQFDTSVHPQLAQSQSLTPLFAQPGVSSQPPPQSRSVTPASLPPPRQQATPFSPGSRFANVVAKAKKNVKI